MVAALALVPRLAASQTTADAEREALFFYNLLPFIHWPPEAFQDASEALRVQIIGQDPFGGALDRLVAGVIGLVEGGVFDLIEDDHAIHFTVNRTALYEARLQISPDILHLTYPLFSSLSPCGSGRSETR